MKLSILIPTLNEEECIGQVIDEIREAMAGTDLDYEIAIIDGLSQDGTREVAVGKGARVIEEKRKGYGRAYKTGFQEARGEVIVTLDGDCTYPADAIPQLFDMLDREKLDFITTDRFANLEEGAMSTMHRVGNFGLSLTARLLFGRIIKDSQSGMWMFRKDALSNLDLTDDGMPLSEEIKIEAFKKLRAKEVPITYRRRVGEVKLSSWRDGWKNMKFLFKKRFVKKKRSS
jgi:glycosyltransferase involved in cell wall biosynthesis